jgi:hypothetical protein
VIRVWLEARVADREFMIPIRTVPARGEEDKHRHITGLYGLHLRQEDVEEARKLPVLGIKTNKAWEGEGPHGGGYKIHAGTIRYFTTSNGGGIIKNEKLFTRRDFCLKLGQNSRKWTIAVQIVTSGEGFM